MKELNEILLAIGMDESDLKDLETENFLEVDELLIDDVKNVLDENNIVYTCKENTNFGTYMVVMK